MNIGGFEKCTLIDYPGKISCIVYTVGCNFRCKFCYNPDIISEENFKVSGRKLISENEIFDYIKKHLNMIDGVSITGGEPTMQFDLLQFCQKIKDLNKLVKLDTNGGSPIILKACIDAGVLDYIAMDIKGPLNLYDKITGYINTGHILESIKIINTSGIPHEYRLTLFPLLRKEDIIEAIKLVSGETIYLQNFEPSHAFDEAARSMTPISKDVVEQIIKETAGIADVRLRGF